MANQQEEEEEEEGGGDAGECEGVDHRRLSEYHNDNTDDEVARPGVDVHRLLCHVMHSLQELG